MKNKVQTRTAALLFTFLLSTGAHSQEASEGPFEFAYWDHQWPVIVDWTNKKMRDYEAENSNVTLEYTIDFVHNRFLPAMQAGQGPDIASPHGYRIVQLLLSQGDYLAPVNLDAFPEFDTYDDLRAAYYPGALDPFTIDGVVYALPGEYTPLATCVNWELMERAGLERTEDNIPKTWDDIGRLGSIVFEQAKADQSASGGGLEYEGFDFPLYHKSWQRHRVSTLLAQFGARIIDENNQVVVDSPEAVAAFEVFGRMYNDYSTGDPNIVIDAQDFFFQFGAGTSAIVNGIAGGLQLLSAKPEVAPNIGCYDYIQPKGLEPTVPVQAHAWVVNTNLSEAKQLEAWKFVNYLTQQWQEPATWSINPARIYQPGVDKPWFETDWFKEQMVAKPALESIPFDALMEGDIVWVTVSDSLFGTDEAVLRNIEIRDELVIAQEEIIFKGVPVEKALADAKSRLQRLGFN